jgi:hypothetical protein
MKAAVLCSTQMPAQKNALGGTITTKHYSSFFGAKTEGEKYKTPQNNEDNKNKTSATSHAQDTKQPGMRIADCKQC